MRIFISVSILFVFSISLSAQADRTNPCLPGCEGHVDGTLQQECTNEIMKSFFKENLIYPEAALEHSIEGFVAVEIRIDSTGQLLKTRVRKGPGYGCNEEAERLVQHFDQWIPGTEDGNPTNARFAVYVVFELPDTGIGSDEPKITSAPGKEEDQKYEIFSVVEYIPLFPAVKMKISMIERNAQMT